MQWISERDATDAALTHQALVLQAEDPIGPAYVEFWKRILSDGCAHAARSGWRSLGIAATNQAGLFIGRLVVWMRRSGTSATPKAGLAAEAHG